MEKLLKLKELSTSTAGAYFLIYFNSKNSEWTVNFNLRGKKVTDPDIEVCLQKAIDYIVMNRIKRDDDSYFLKK